MARARAGLQTFPSVFWNVIAEAKQGKGYTMELPARNLAVNMRHRFHSFRKAMIDEGHPDGELLTNVVSSLIEAEGKFSLQFVYLGEILSPPGPDPVVPGIDAPQASPDEVGSAPASQTGVTLDPASLAAMNAQLGEAGEDTAEDSVEAFMRGEKPSVADPK